MRRSPAGPSASTILARPLSIAQRCVSPADPGTEIPAAPRFPPCALPGSPAARSISSFSVSVLTKSSASFSQSSLFFLYSMTSAVKSAACSSATFSFCSAASFSASFARDKVFPEVCVFSSSSCFNGKRFFTCRRITSLSSFTPPHSFASARLLPIQIP